VLLYRNIANQKEIEMTKTLIQDIANLEESIILLQEGASDEKHMALANLVRMLSEKREQLELIATTFKTDIDTADGIRSTIMGFKIK